MNILYDNKEINIAYLRENINEIFNEVIIKKNKTFNCEIYINIKDNILIAEDLLKLYKEPEEEEFECKYLKYKTKYLLLINYLKTW